MAAKIKRTPEPPRTCIFCGGAPISKEHVWAEWMRPYLPRGQGWQQVTAGQTDADIAWQPGPLNRKGDARSQKLKVVCTPCNTGWMSCLQNETKPVLLPLMTGDGDTIQHSGAATLAAWATMFALVYETSAPDYKLHVDTERSVFKSEKHPPPYWRYWCAPFDGESSPAVHVGFGSNYIRPVITVIDPIDIPRVQLTLCGAGKICFAIFGANFPQGFQTFAQLVSMFVTQAGFVQFWPINSSIQISSRRKSPFVYRDLQAIGQSLINTVRLARAEGRRRDIPPAVS